MLDSACLIFNPVAGQGNSDQDLSQIKSHLEPHIRLDVQFTTEEISAQQLAKEAVERNVNCVIASGGDGTISEVASALVGSDIPLGVIARGTANAFANALDIPDNIEEACQTIVSGKQRVIDVGKCAGRTMTLLAGIGAEAELVDDADREAKNSMGMLAYFFSAFKQLQKFETFQAQLETDDKIIEVEAAAITIANVAPASSVLAQGPAGIVEDDGLLDVTIAAPQNRSSAVAASYHLLQTAIHDEGAERDDIGYLRTQRIKITTDPPQKVVLDGEIIGETPIEVECISRQLTVIVPDHLSSEPAEKLEGLPGLKVKSKTDPSLNDEESEEENSDVDVLVVDYRLLDELSFAEEQ